LKAGTSKDDFPALRRHQIPLMPSNLHAILRDIVSVSDKAINGKILTFPLFNQRMCSLVHVPSSRNLYRFIRNAKETGWVKAALLASASGAEEGEEVAAYHLLKYMCTKYNDIFVHVASAAGILLTRKEMDAASAAAMWEESNCPLRAQRIILRHLKAFFGRRITVPEHEMRELELGALLPVCGSIDIGGNEIFFWYKNIDDAIIHRMKLEFEYRGRDFFQNKGYNKLDVVLGGDHGARRFRAVIQLIFRNNNCPSETYSVTIHVGNIDCNKDTRKILDETIGKELNSGLKRIYGKILVIHIMENVCTPSFSDELPGNNNNFYFAFEMRTFVAGDLAFFSTLLGKENMSSVWCTWCKLSKVEWAQTGHPLGECWTINDLLDLRQNVACGNLASVTENLKGCMEEPLFDSVPVDNYIIPVLHLLIGIGNNLLNSLLEWVAERVEKLSHHEVVHRNEVIFAEARHQKFKADYDTWIENEGITLTDLQVQKASLAFMLSERVM